MLVQVIGKPLRYGKFRQLHSVGAAVDMPDAHGRLFLALRRVKLADIEPIVTADVPCGPLNRAFDHPSLDELPKPKRTYKRRDMQAE